MNNLSVPTDAVLPHIFYRDVTEAISWLSSAFGFIEHYRYLDGDGGVAGAQMWCGRACFMLGKSRAGRGTPLELGGETQSLSVWVDDVNGHFAKAKSFGAKILEDPHETVYGEFQYATEDFAGHHWIFSRHARNLGPADWGAVISRPPITPAQISPMLAVGDGSAAIEFYRAAFGATVLWQIGTGADIVAGLSVYGAPLFLAHEAPPHGTRRPASAGFTTVRVELSVDDPFEVHERALRAGAIERSAVVEHQYATTGLQPLRKMLQGAFVDPFGHMWLVGKFLE